MKKIVMLSSALLLTLQVGCSSKDEKPTPKPDTAPKTEEKAIDWVYNQVDEIGDIREDIVEAYEDNSFTDHEKRHIQKELKHLHNRLTSENATKYTTKEELKELTAAYDNLVTIVNDTKATKGTIETAIKDMDTKFKTLFARTKDKLEYAETDVEFWMDEFAYDAYDLVADGKDYVAGEEEKMELKEDIAELKADWNLEKVKIKVTDAEKATHKEIMDIVDKLDAAIDKDTNAVKQHVDELDAKLKEQFKHIEYKYED